DNAFVPLPLDGGGYDKYYFVTVTPQGKGHSRDNVLLDAILAEEGVGTSTPEPASLALLGAIGLAAIQRRRR
ncbi:MAG: PEP-CTERM sorting domain-containing protein, partial [Planctomycetota bacterium]|nr:PEP-CTERM sorting domain-containing protein [Planctomycetota bacterium]